MKRKSLLIALLVAMFLPLAMNAQTRSLKKQVSQAPRPQLQLEVAGQLQTIEEFQPGKMYQRATVNTRDNVLYSTGFNSQDELTGIGIYDADEDGNNWGWYNKQGVTGVSGDYALGSQSYDNDAGALTPDNWVIFPAITLPTDNAQYFVSVYAQSYGAYGETMGIFVAPEDDEYMYLVGSDFNLTTGDYELCEVDISEYAGQTIEIIIRHYNCTDGFYLFIDDFSITQHIPSECEAPNHLTVNNVLGNSAELSWTGFQDNYNLQYRQAAGIETFFFEGFESGSIPSTWTIYTEGEAPQTDGWYVINPSSSLSFAAQEGSYVASAWSWSSVEYNADNWLITPLLNLQGTLKFWVNTAANWPDSYEVLLSTRGNAIADFTTTLQAMAPAAGGWNEVSIDLSPYTNQSGYIAIHHVSYDANYLLIDAFGLYGDEIPAGRWTTVRNVTNPYTVSGLENNTEYEWQVQGNCTSGQTDWVAGPNFTTLGGNTFIYDGDWNEARNWLAGEVPADGADVTIAAKCTIPAGYLANAGAVNITDGGSLTIQDGGQLIHTNTGVWATMEKEILPYSGAKDNYYLIAPPVTQLVYEEQNYTFPDEIPGLLDNDYDLYQYDATQEFEWLNYKAGSFNYIFPGIGYLYANSNKVVLEFEGELHPFVDDFANDYYPLNYTASSEELNGFNLVGNLFATDGYIVIADYDIENGGVSGLAQDVYFYTMGDGELVAGSGAVAPMQGVMVQASAENQVALCFTEPIRNNKSVINMSLMNNGKMVDAAYLQMKQGSTLEKLQLNPNHSKIYMPVDGKNLAAAVAENNNGEMPISFKAENNGTYTLSFSTENIELGYLHLIDNMTGKDVDLLSTPSYSFEAKSTDYANRFKLVFATGNADDNDFAFFSNGSFVINNEGNATLQVMDVTGRMISSESINGCANVNVNAAPGVYMIRLVNGENVKVQKVVVR